MSLLIFNLPVITQNDDTNIVSFKIKWHSSDSRGKLNHFTGLNFLETENTGDTVTNRNDGSVLFNII